MLNGLGLIMDPEPAFLKWAQAQTENYVSQIFNREMVYNGERKTPSR